ncbi:MAG TPA: LPS export ABC transporter periplasmic protein LptC [Cyclobacteriaceae bacterium]|nr:LPS export ABC transporter periplasmic protein LptC [Cyclobacteriaceae bacterium]
MNWKNPLVLVVASAITLASCRPKEAAKPVVYDGPLKQAENISMRYTERERLKTILQAKKLNEFQNGDREFPEGVYIEFYDVTGKLTSTLRANTAFFFKEDNKWRGRGKVEVINLEKHQQLNTEELFWKPDTKKIFTDKFVTITDNDDVLYGTGLTANQDLSDYHLKDTSGNFHSTDE